MWIPYALFGGLILVAIVGGFVGGPVVTVVAVLLALLALGFILYTRMRGVSVDEVKDPSIPSSRDSAYEPRVNPSRSPTGSSTGS